MMQNNRNYFIAIGLSVLIVLAWQFLYMNPRIEAQRKADELAKAQQHTTQQAQTGQAQTGQAQTPAAGTGAPINGSLPATGQSTPTVETVDEALAKTPRVIIDTPALTGSIN